VRNGENLSHISWGRFGGHWRAGWEKNDIGAVPECEDASDDKPPSRRLTPLGGPRRTGSGLGGIMMGGRSAKGAEKLIHILGAPDASEATDRTSSHACSSGVFTTATVAVEGREPPAPLLAPRLAERIRGVGPAAAAGSVSPADLAVDEP
jgi:hypothetical protein